jgi:putative DNA primase/helicase
MTVASPFAPFDTSEPAGQPGDLRVSPAPITPVPVSAGPARFTHPQYGDPTATWAYRDGAGLLLGHTVRFDCEGRKKILPRTWCRHEDGSERWSWKSFATPRPLYGLDRLAARQNAPLLLVEGEKTADAAQQLLPSHVVMTWPGGSKAGAKVDWSPLSGRAVTLWPDADAEGLEGMEKVKRLLADAGAARTSIVQLPGNLTEGWDLADRIPDGMDVEELVRSAKPATGAAIMPPGYQFTRYGLVWRDDAEDSSDLFLAGVFDVPAETRDGEGTSWGVLLRWDDHDGREHKYALPRSMLAGDGADARRILLDAGLYVSPAHKAREKLNHFLGTVRSPERARATSRIGWHDGVFVLPDGAIGTSGSNELFLLQHTGSLKHAFRQQGRLSDWQENVARLAPGNSRLVLAVSTAFASALIGPCDGESGGIHFRGPSSTGKSTALIMAASVWGGGDDGEYVRSWRATSNGLEGVALAHCDALLCLDEISEVAPREASEISYMLGNGSGKSRSTREGLAKPPARWRLLFLSSGEVSLADKIAEEGRSRRTTAGQSVRLIDLPADARAGLGLFEHLHGSDSAERFARQIKQASTLHYGTAARAFIKYVVEEPDCLQHRSEFYRQFVGTYVDPVADGQVHRVAQRFALIALAGELAITARILPWEAGTAVKAAGRCLEDWVNSRGGIEPAEIRGGIEQVRSFISAHGSSRFLQPWEPGGGNQPLREVAGFRKREGDGWDYYVTSSAWRDEVCKGFNSTTIAEALHQRGLLAATQNGRLNSVVRVPGEGPQRLYHLHSKLLGNSHDDR